MGPGVEAHLLRQAVLAVDARPSAPSHIIGEEVQTASLCSMPIPSRSSMSHVEGGPKSSGFRFLQHFFPLISPQQSSSLFNKSASIEHPLFKKPASIEHPLFKKSAATIDECPLFKIKNDEAPTEVEIAEVVLHVDGSHCGAASSSEQQTFPAPRSIGTSDDRSTLVWTPLVSTGGQRLSDVLRSPVDSGYPYGKNILVSIGAPV